MAKNNGIYYLIKEDMTDNTRYYFDFETMEYSQDRVKGVQLSTIDAMTSLFSSPTELDQYLDREGYVDRETPFKYFISYRIRRKDDEKFLTPVWDDTNISAISKITDGKVDYSNYLVYDLLFKLVEELKDVQNGFAMTMINSKNNDTKICDYNKVIVGAIAGLNNKNEIPSGIIMEAFSSYKEFRSLYLGHKSQVNKENSLANQLKKLLEKKSIW